MSFLKILSRWNRKKGQSADPGRPDDSKLLRPMRVTVVSFRGTVSPTQSLAIKVKVKKNKSKASLVEVRSGGRKGRELRDERAVKKGKPPKGKP